MSLFLLIQIISIIIGSVFLYIAFKMVRPREEEQKRVQGDFLFYLCIGLFFFFFTFFIEYLM